MGFSRGFGSSSTPTTFNACQRLWLQASARKLAKGYLILGHNTGLYKSGEDCFYVRFHHNVIVTYYPEYKVIHARGYSESPTTQDRISRLAGVYMSNNSSLGFNERVRVNGYPYFDGMRIDNYGRVLKEDQRPDFKTRPKKEVVQRYTNLFRRIEKLCTGRYGLGEFRSTEPYNPTVSQREALPLIETLIAEGETFIPFRLMCAILPSHQTTDTPFRDLLKRVKESCRDSYYKANDGYETIEVK